MDSAEANLQIIQGHYERAFDCLNTGLSEDEAGHKATALMYYRLGRQHLLQGLEVPTRGQACVGSVWESARQMQLKMNETLSTITTRLAILETTPTLENAGAQSQPLYPALPVIQTGRTHSPMVGTAQCLYPSLPQLDSAPRRAGLSDSLLDLAEVPSLPVSPDMALGIPGDQPPAYTPQASDGHLSFSHSTEKGLMTTLDDWELVDRPQVTQSLGVDGQELFHLTQGVQIFFVAADGQVSAPSYPGFLRIILCADSQQTDLSHPPAYLQVCNWLYPLYPDLPVLLSNTGVFTFPDMTANAPGSYVGVVLSSALPTSDRARFHEHLSQLTLLRVQTADEGAAVEAIDLGEKIPIDPTAGSAEGTVLPEWSGKLSQNILAGTTWLGRGLMKGGNYAGKAIQKGASSLRDHITPREVPSEINPRVSRGLNVAKDATGGAVKVSRFIVDGIATVADRVVKELAPHVKKHGSKLIPESLKRNKDGQSNLDGALLVASSGIQGLSTVWTSMETAAKDIGRSLASETVQTVRHKYGDGAGQAADTTVKSVINVGMTAYNIDNIGIKAALKTTGKQTAKAMGRKEGDGENKKETEKGAGPK